MAKTKSKRKNNEEKNPKESEERERQQQNGESLELQQQESCGTEGKSGYTKKKKLKKDIQLNEELIDYEVNKNNDEKNCEEFEDKDCDKYVHKVEEQTNKKSKKNKSKQKKTINESTDENCSEDKGIKVFNLSQSLSAITTRDSGSGQTQLSLKRMAMDSDLFDTTFDITSEEWMALKETVPQIDDILSSN